ncbi:Aryl hydrocarbon receptor nuclear translocator-like protein 2 [Collichthys lucidus]|uniref:Aryl hydrocarbon receptor nuclear translocator-like protein 2 n=1 Tax=Collichthys lucidus TaxID=240159 RepID=A0A4U5VR53_COLLU|nr:Aryl hydrocarbon receptor nuclear translocator-like protein 2 [Collichthys lucidus]
MVFLARFNQPADRGSDVYMEHFLTNTKNWMTLETVYCAASTVESSSGWKDPAAEEEGPSQAASSLAAGELPRKRKGDVERSDIHAQQSLDIQMDEDLSKYSGVLALLTHLKEHWQSIFFTFLIPLFADLKERISREPHSQIEKRRRDKMNNLIDELSAMIPACQPMARKLDKLTVLRKAVQHLKALKAGTSSAFTDTTYKPPILPHDDLRHLLLRVELTGQSLFDFIHHKDINKVKEQLASSELYPRQRLIDAATGVQVPADSPVRLSHMTTGARRSFFCRMKHSRVAGKHEDKHSLPRTSRKKDTYRYCTLHCTGYMRSWPSSQLDSDGDTEKETSNLTCLVTVCRLLPHMSHQPSKDVNVKPAEFMTRCAIDGKFIFVDQRATTVIGYLPQEVLGTSCYEYFHQDDLQHLAEKHRQVLRSKEKIETPCYKFKTKYGSYVSLQSQWFSFTNPWTKEVEFIVSLNRVLSLCMDVSTVTPLCTSRGPGHTKDEEAGSSKALQGEPSQLDLDSMVVPGLSSFSSDEAAMAVIMSLLETDVNMGQSGDFEDLHWPF